MLKMSPIITFIILWHAVCHVLCEWVLNLRERVTYIYLVLFKITQCIKKMDANNGVCIGNKQYKSVILMKCAIEFELSTSDFFRCIFRIWNSWLLFNWILLWWRNIMVFKKIIEVRLMLKNNNEYIENL